MPVVSDAPAELYTLAWIVLLVICAFYVAVGIALRWRPQHTVGIVRYEPPQGVSPAVAAFLVQGGRCERAFAAALISLAAKGYLRILQRADCFALEKLRDPDAALPLEESATLALLFPSAARDYSFDSRDSSGLFEAYRDFRGIVQDNVTPEWMSTHVVLWLLGLTYSLTVPEIIISATPQLGNGMSLASIGFLSIFILLGGSCYVAALRSWPATLRKVASLLPGSVRPRRPLDLNDAIPLFLTASALVGFVLLAALVSTKFAVLATAAVTMNVFSRRLLNAPTSAGRKVLAELLGFREFLSRAEADRLNRDNQPGETPRTLGHYIAYAVALGVEHGWGEEFAGNLLELLEIDQAYSLPGNIPAPDNRPTELKLFDRRK